MARLDNKVALITGATGAIGAAMARIFAQEGAHVGLTDTIDTEVDDLLAELRANGRRAIFAPMDVTSRESVAAGVARIEQALGSVDVLINNAGVSIYGTIDTITDAEWRRVIDINLTGVFLCTQSIAEGMKARRRGRVINIGSLAGKVGGLLTPHGQMTSAAYAASKGGVMAMTKTLAKDLGPFGITVNALAPGPIWTPMIETVNPNLLSFITGLIPMGRLGQPEDVGHAAAFLASDQASWITGHWLDIDGGLAMA